MYHRHDSLTDYCVHCGQKKDTFSYWEPCPAEVSPIKNVVAISHIVRQTDNRRAIHYQLGGRIVK